VGQLAGSALLAIDQPPSAIGIATGGATIYDTPGGRVLKSVRATGVLNVTGISEDGRWLSVYDEAAAFLAGRPSVSWCSTAPTT
jgi:hypothetical protein